LPHKEQSHAVSRGKNDSKTNTAKIKQDPNDQPHSCQFPPSPSLKNIDDRRDTESNSTDVKQDPDNEISHIHARSLLPSREENLIQSPTVMSCVGRKSGFSTGGGSWCISFQAIAK